MSTSGSLYVLYDSVLYGEYVKALFQTLKDFLLRKNQGHCQRIDYLPRPVMDGLGQKLSSDADLLSQKIICRLVVDKATGLQPWEVTGSGAVKLREDATYSRIKVFCALFPAGVRLAEEDSLNVSTFKTDDADSFEALACLERHLAGIINLLPKDESEPLRTILNHVDIRRRPVQDRLRYVLAIQGQKQISGKPISWETAGAYLYELGMVPDFGLDGGNFMVQLTRNSQCMSILADGEKSLSQNLQRLISEAELADEERRRDLMAYLSGINILSTITWLPPICHDDRLRKALSFDEWRFAHPITGIHIELKPLCDPKKPTKVASGLTMEGGALTSDGKKPIQISWKVTPANSPDLGRLLVTVIRSIEDKGEVDVIPPQYVPAKRKSFSVPISDNYLLDDEKCIAVIRIQGLTKMGIPISDANDVSEEFWIKKGEEISDPPDIGKGQRVRHLDDILFKEVYATGNVYGIRNADWDLKRNYIYSLRLTNNRRGDLWLNPLLRDLEHVILQTPESLGIYDADVRNKRTAKVEDFKTVTLPNSINQIADDFYKARREFFTAVHRFHNGTGVIEIIDLHELRDEVLAYIQTYLELLTNLKGKVENAAGMGGVNTVLHDYAGLLRIDTVLMQVGPTDNSMEVMLLSPTHPLRILWLFQYETLVRGWIDDMKGKKPHEIEALIDVDVLDKITSLNVPNAIPTGKGCVYINTDNYGLFWGIYPEARVPDLRTAVNAAFQVLGSGSLGGVLSTVTSKQAADKIERYLCHHPYVQTLKINVINPGDGAFILDAIKLLLEREPYTDLNFDIKFFAPAKVHHQLVGNAFDDFMARKYGDERTGGKSLSDTEELLLSPNQNPLFPKLIYAKHEIDELLNDKEGAFDAHLTMVIDFFGTTVSTREHVGSRGSSSVYNLLSEYVTDYHAGETTATWSRMVATNRCPDLNSDGVTAQLFNAQQYFARLGAAVFDWSNSLNKYLTVQLELTDQDGKNHLRTLDKVHQISDWVFTIDRNFGIEFYDDPIKGPANGAGYLIDYSPEFLDAVAHRMIISTFHQQEIESILRNGFVQLLVDDPEQAGEVLDAAKIAQVLQILKSISGKLALKLINNPKQAQEVIGLALTRLSLEEEGRLAGRILIPIDSHIDLFYLTPSELQNAELTLKRTDLMLVNLKNDGMEVDLIEVKNRKASSPGAIFELQEEIVNKNKSTEEHFRYHYLSMGKPRIDAVIKNKELTNILAFYIDKASRYGFIKLITNNNESLDKDIQKGLEAVNAGKSETVFRHYGYIFNGSNWGDVEEKKIHENTIKIFGRRGISKLMALSFDEAESGEGNTVQGDNGVATQIVVENEVSPVGLDGKEEKQHSVSTIAQPATPIIEDSLSHVLSDVPPRINSSDAGSSTIQGRPRDVLEEKDMFSDEKKQERVSNIIPVKVYLGLDTTTSKEVFWDPYNLMNQRRLLNQHLLIVGKSGSGKSETTKSILYELNREGVPAIIFDFQGEYGSGDFFDVVKPQVFDVMDGIPVNPFEIPIDPQTGKKRRPIEMMFRLADTINSVFAGSGDIQLGKLREAIKECYIQTGFEMNLPAPDDRDPPTLEMLSAILNKWSTETGGQIRNLQVRLQPLFESGIFQQGRANYSFDDLLKKTTVILLTTGIKDLMVAASRFVLEKVYSAMLIKGISKYLRVVVCVDEAHKLCNDPKITDLAKEARKYGLGLLLSSQETRDFHQSIFANAGTQIVLALEEADAGIIAKQFSTDKIQQRIVKETIMAQESGLALIRSSQFQPYSQLRVKSFTDRIKN